MSAPAQEEDRMKPEDEVRSVITSRTTHTCYCGAEFAERPEAEACLAQHVRDLPPLHDVGTHISFLWPYDSRVGLRSGQIVEVMGGDEFDAQYLVEMEDRSRVWVDARPRQRRPYEVKFWPGPTQIPAA